MPTAEGANNQRPDRKAFEALADSHKGFELPLLVPSLRRKQKD